MKSFYRIILLVSVCLSATSLVNAEENKAKQPEAKELLQRLSHSLKQLNFSTSFVVVKNNQAEPYHWFHGVDQNNAELEILSLLNGPRRDILRKGDVISYIEPELPPYSVLASHISGPIPSILTKDISELESSYDFVSVGRSRVLGRPAQLIRIVSKDQHRFGHWLWVDQNTGLLLKLAVITKKGQLLEQVQFTHLDITEQPSESIKQLQTAELPHVVDLPKTNQVKKLNWQVTWVPDSFKQLKANRHRINLSKQAVEFMMYSDGLVEFSVYVNPSKDKDRPAEFVMDGATVVLNQAANGFEISVVGKIPTGTAKKIANSVVIGITSRLGK